MSELDAVESTKDGPNTLTSLIGAFGQLGLKPGMTVVVHASMGSIGWVCGGAPSVILALESVLTESGTLVMPTHSSDLSDPARWQDPPVPRSWWDTIREEMPAFDAHLTPTRRMGVIAETFRKQHGVERSRHPQVSFAAWGKHKAFVTQDSSYGFALGEQSPLARVYELDGHVLLIGTEHSTNTSLHLAEYRADFPDKKMTQNAFPVIDQADKVWKAHDDIEYFTDDFNEIGKHFEAAHKVSSGQVGNAACRLMSQRSLVDFAEGWMTANR